jgi:hypothetical protein
VFSAAFKKLELEKSSIENAVVSRTIFDLEKCKETNCCKDICDTGSAWALGQTILHAIFQTKFSDPS